jgi:hypothetical protein
MAEAIDAALAQMIAGKQARPSAAEDRDLDFLRYRFARLDRHVRIDFVGIREIARGPHILFGQLGPEALVALSPVARPEFCNIDFIRGFQARQFTGHAASDPILGKPSCSLRLRCAVP